VAKYEDAISGQYSMKISSSARDANGLPTWPGCAHNKFKPTQTYFYAGAAVRIDSIVDGRIEIRVKQRQPNGFYVKIGGWKDSVATKIVQQVWMPLAMTSMDSLLIEVWAFNKDTPPYLENKTFAAAIVDDIVLTNTNSIDDIKETQVGELKVFPNPAGGYFKLKLDTETRGDCSVEILDMQGKKYRGWELGGLNEAVFDTDGLPSGIYLVRIKADEKSIARLLQVIQRKD
jgi:hypothetical protein